MNCKSYFLLFSAIGTTFFPSAMGQVVGNFTTVDASGKVTVTAADGVVFGGSLGSGVTVGSGIGGPRLLWYPRKAAFRVGTISSSSGGYGSEWNDINIGDYSIAGGWGAKASGYASVSLGYSTSVTGYYSSAFGYGTTASGYYGAFASGWGTTASGTASFASGGSTMATGNHSTAFGQSTQATSTGSTALGGFTIANAFYATSLGISTTASSYASLVIGRNNVISGSTGSWVETDPLFVVGNGNGITGSPDQYRDAFVVYKNGDVRIKKPQGDISMGQFAN